ncbi:hypothetical protein LUZ60_006463 [Juncus effusus]|nr:hypothetical protein LUZ60_006463 [Juncus effusus]
MIRSSYEFTPFGIITAVFLILSCFTFSTEAYDVLDPTGNITIKWDIMQWTTDGYVGVVTMYNYQKYRHIQAPGWTLGWTWTKKEIIWGMIGAQATEQGDCSKFKAATTPPHSCVHKPSIVDLLPGTPYNQQITNCCKGGVLASFTQDPLNSVSAFQISVGQSGTTKTTVRAPKNVTLLTPGPGYTCSPAVTVTPSRFLSADGRRVTQAARTWNITCTYSQFLGQRTPTCCVSLSSFYNDTIVNCPTCSCGCQNNNTNPGSCVEANSPYLSDAINGPGKSTNAPLVQCTSHMCPIRVHWHVKLNYQEYWRVKVAITNFNYRMNYSQWNLVAQHPNFNNLSLVYSFMHKSLNPYGNINDTAMFWGIKYYNDLLMQAGPDGNVQSEILFQKDPSFSFSKGWAFPRRIYFNGDNCVMPPPDQYPMLPNSSPRIVPVLLVWTVFINLLIL